jgi:hypothetical protein
MSDGVGRALAVIGSLGSCPPIDVVDVVGAGDGFLLALDIVDGDDDGDGVGSALDVIFQHPQKLSRGDCLKRARAARASAEGVSKHVVKRIDKYNAQEACRFGDRIDVFSKQPAKFARNQRRRWTPQALQRVCFGALSSRELALQARFVRRRERRALLHINKPRQALLFCSRGWLVGGEL